MTPYLTTTAATIPAPAKPSRDVSAPRETESKTVSTDKNDDTSKDPSGFEELMAGLLNTPPLTQTAQPAVVKTIANDVSATVASTDVAPLVVVPQDTPVSSLAAATTSGEFSDDLLAALTPGTPAIPASDMPADLPPVAVPVLAQNADFVPAPELTINPEMIQAEPRVIASGLSPNQMQGVKDQVTSPAQNPAPAAKDAAPIMTVAITPDKNAPVIVVNAPANTQVANPSAMTATSAVSAPVAVIAQTQTPAPSAAPASVPASDTDIAASADIIVTNEGFDPVEFRIAQSFQRPASSAASSLAKPAQPVQAPDVSSGYQSNADVATAANVVTKGKIDLPPLSSGSPTIATALPADTLAAGDTLSAAPVATPMIASPLTSPVVQSSSATQSIPAVQTVAAIINKAAKEGGPQTISLRLDPPDLGKLEVQMKYNKGESLKVHLIVEKADTAELFQKDAHVLESALKNAGIQTDGSSLSFEFSQNHGSFNQAMGQDSAPKGQNQAWTPATTSESPPIETSMDIYTDSRTGLTRYNIKA